MSVYTNILRKQPKIYWSAIKQDWRNRHDKERFRATGTQVYCGRQGSGKTLSAVKHVLELKARYPKSKIVTNLKLNVEWDYTEFHDAGELAKLLTSVNNGKYGVVYLIDEIHTYFNALDSKNISMSTFTEISQQRKQAKCIVGTSQLFLRLAKPFREQCDNVIVCTTHFNKLTINTAYDGMTLEQDYTGKLVGEIQRTGFFFHSKQLRDAYDTYQKVVSSQDQFAAENRPLDFSQRSLKTLQRR